MIRSTISLLHTVLGAAATTGGLWLVAQSAANSRWEQTFYGRVSEQTSALWLAGLVATTLGLSQIMSAWGWFLGSRRSGYVLVGLSLLQGLSGPLTLTALLAATSALILLDIMVQSHREQEP